MRFCILLTVSYIYIFLFSPDAKPDLNTFEREWQIRALADLPLAFKRVQIRFGISTALQFMCDDIEDFDDLLGGDFHIPDIPEVLGKVRQLQENRQKLMSSQAKMMATQALLVEGQAA